MESLAGAFYVKDTLLGDYEDFHVRSIYVTYTVFQVVENIQRLEHGPLRCLGLYTYSYNMMTVLRIMQENAK